MAKANPSALDINQEPLKLATQPFTAHPDQAEHIVSDLKVDQTLPANDTTESIVVTSHQHTHQQHNTSKSNKKKLSERSKLEDTWNTPQLVEEFSGRRRRSAQQASLAIQQHAQGQMLKQATPHTAHVNEPTMSTSALTSSDTMMAQDMPPMPPLAEAAEAEAEAAAAEAEVAASSSAPHKRKATDVDFDDTLIKNASDSQPAEKVVVVEATDGRDDDNVFQPPLILPPPPPKAEATSKQKMTGASKAAKASSKPKGDPKPKTAPKPKAPRKKAEAKSSTPRKKKGPVEVASPMALPPPVAQPTVPLSSNAASTSPYADRYLDRPAPYQQFNTQGSPYIGLPSAHAPMPSPFNAPMQSPGGTYMQPSTNVYMQSPDNVHMQSPGNTHMHSPGNTHMQSPGNTHMQSPGNTHMQSPGNTHMQSPGNVHMHSPNNIRMQSPGNTHMQPSANTYAQSPMNTQNNDYSRYHANSPTSYYGPPAPPPPPPRHFTGSPSFYQNPASAYPAPSSLYQVPTSFTAPPDPHFFSLAAVPSLPTSRSETSVAPMHMDSGTDTTTATTTNADMLHNVTVQDVMAETTTLQQPPLASTPPPVKPPRKRTITPKGKGKQAKVARNTKSPKAEHAAALVVDTETVAPLPFLNDAEQVSMSSDTPHTDPPLSSAHDQVVHVPSSEDIPTRDPASDATTSTTTAETTKPAKKQTKRQTQPTTKKPRKPKAPKAETADATGTIAAPPPLPLWATDAAATTTFTGNTPEASSSTSANAVDFVVVQEIGKPTVTKKKAPQKRKAPTKSKKAKTEAADTLIVDATANAADLPSSSTHSVALAPMNQVPDITFSATTMDAIRLADSSQEAASEAMATAEVKTDTSPQPKPSQKANASKTEAMDTPMLGATDNVATPSPANDDVAPMPAINMSEDDMPESLVMDVVGNEAIDATTDNSVSLTDNEAAATPLKGKGKSTAQSSGKKKTSPSAPRKSSTTKVPKAPKAPKEPKAPKTPKAPKKSKESEVPEVPKEAEVSEAPKESDVSEVPKESEVSGVPKESEVQNAEATDVPMMEAMNNDATTSTPAPATVPTSSIEAPEADLPSNSKAVDTLVDEKAVDMETTKVAPDTTQMAENETAAGTAKAIKKPAAESPQKRKPASTTKASVATKEPSKRKTPKKKAAEAPAIDSTAPEATLSSSLTNTDALDQGNQATTSATPEKPAKRKRTPKKKAAEPVEQQDVDMQDTSKGADGSETMNKRKEHPESSIAASRRQSTRQRKKPKYTEEDEDEEEEEEDAFMEDADEAAEHDQIQQEQDSAQILSYLQSRDSFLVNENFKVLLPQLLSGLPIHAQADLAKLLPPPDLEGAIASNPIPLSFLSPSNTHFWEAATKFQEVLGMGGFEPETIKKREAMRAEEQQDDTFKDDNYEEYWGERLERDKKEKAAAKAKAERAARGRGGRGAGNNSGSTGAAANRDKGKSKAV